MAKAKGQFSRRRFLGTSAAATIALAQRHRPQAQEGAPAIIRREPSDTINVGFIGCGVRGKQLMEYAGFAAPTPGARGARRGRGADTRSSETENLPRPLNIRCLGVSDLYDGNLRLAQLAGGRDAKAYPHYEELLADPAVDAVFIATSDHNHAPIGIAAAAAGKHLYSEKCFTRTIEEAKQYREAVHRAGVVFQLGHQTRSGSMLAQVRESLKGIGETGALGKVALIEMYTNRNDPNGAWLYKIPADASPKTIDWDRFLGGAPRRPFDADRFFRWRKYWDYGTGLAGDLLTHEFDAVQNITGLGIPDTATATGGIYYWKDGRDQNRETPDTFQATFNFEKEGVVVTYTATLANGWRREIHLFGKDGTLVMTGGPKIIIDKDTDRESYIERIEKDDLLIPIGDPEDLAKREQIRATTSETQLWTIDKGIYIDVVNGKEINVTALHILNFIESVRAGNLKTNCNLDMAFEEAVAAHMATLAYQRGRRVRWNPQEEKVVDDA